MQNLVIDTIFYLTMRVILSRVISIEELNWNYVLKIANVCLSVFVLTRHEIFVAAVVPK